MSGFDWLWISVGGFVCGVLLLRIVAMIMFGPIESQLSEITGLLRDIKKGMR